MQNKRNKDTLYRGTEKFDIDSCYAELKNISQDDFNNMNICYPCKAGYPLALRGEGAKNFKRLTITDYKELSRVNPHHNIGEAVRNEPDFLKIIANISNNNNNMDVDHPFR
jgi:hypothetical protein